MATTVRPVGAGIISTAGAQKEAQVAGGLGFDWAAVALGSIFAGGVYLDGWAHNHGKVDNTFFTIWHAALYSGYALYAAFLVISLVRNHARGYEWQRALPAGYEVSLLGAIVFAVGGVGDMIWHTIFGVETNTAALLSPTHLILAFGLVLMVGGPLRAAWLRWPHRSAPGIADLAPAILSATLIMATLAFFTQFAHPLVEALAGASPFTGSDDPSMGVAAILLQAGLVAGMVLLLVRQWTLPLGTLTVMFTLSAILISFMHDQGRFIWSALAAGVLCDLLLRVARPSDLRVGAFRLCAFAVPAIFFALYYIVLALTEGIGWVIHVWAGSIVMAGVVGLLLSYLSVPPLADAETA
jgi:hypothetical protein